MNRVILLILLELGVWSLDLSSAPLAPANPYPADLATNVPANADLTWTPGDMELIRNGGFEITNFTGWVRVNEGGGGGGANNNTYINDGRRAAFFPGVTNDPPFAGTYCAVTDQDGPGSITLYQDVFVPAAVGSVWFTWADQIHNFANIFSSDPPPNTQEYRVEVRATNNSVLALCYRTEPNDPVWTAWNKRAFDLTPYKGRTVRIAFQEVQWRNFFHMYYDNVSVRVRDTGPVTYDVFLGTNAVPSSNEFRGTVTSGTFALPQLLPQTKYFWRVNTRIGADVFPGPVWQFTTAAVGPLDHFTWAPIASPQAPGTPFGVLLMARDAGENLLTNFAGIATVAARSIESASTNTLQGDVIPSAYAAFENATVGYSFTPNQDLLVLGFHGQPGAKISIWTDDGLLLGSQPPIQLFGNRTYRLGSHLPGTSTNYLRFDGLSTFPHGTFGQAYEGTGDAFPTRLHPARWWEIDMIYIAATVSSPILSQAVQLSGGSWNGTLSIPSTGLIDLRGSDSNGHVGVANVFSVAENLRVEMLRDFLLRFRATAGRDYLIEISDNLADWSPFGPAIHAAGAIIERPIAPTNGRAFFRVQRVP
ncbi:MAG TPA: hypothetical protein VJ063_01560 [Verrucomicrobiae bacterium]|nr:hypothetical protein [Verrucomicrobiae bacterium]